MARRLGLCWHRAADNIASQTEAMCIRYSEALDTVARVPLDQVTPANTVELLAEVDAQTATESIEVVLPAFCASSDPAVRAASAKAKATLKQLWNEVYQRPDVYERIKQLKGQALEPELARLRDRMDLLFQRNGAALSPADRKALSDLRTREAQLCGAFEQAINEDNTTVILSEAELDGLTDLDRFEAAAEPGHYIIGLKAPQALPVLTRAKIAAVRDKVEHARIQRCPENAARFRELLDVRHRAAQLLGYRSHSAFLLETRMMRTPEAATDFVTGILAKMRPAAEADLKTMEAMKLALNETGPVQTSDLHYLSDKLKEAHLGIEEEAMRPYFPMTHVMGEIMAIYSDLLKLTFTRVTDDEVWHEEVEMYEVKDATTGELQGYMFLDLYPREGKYGHQCVVPIRPSCIRQGQAERQVPAVALIGNNPKPTPLKPSLLTHSQVAVLFHEFGHLVHGVLTQAKYTMFSWSWSVVPYLGGVELDMLETPSMMLENWPWEDSVVARLSKHYETGARLPAELTATLAKSRYFLKPFGESRYLAMALYDLQIHDGSPPEDPEALFRQVFQEHAMLSMPTDSNYLSTWYHPVMGYDAGYFSYGVSEVYARDLYETFCSRGDIMDPESGRRYRETILQPGATQDGGQMLEAFLGRPPSDAAYFKQFPAVNA